MRSVSEYYHLFPLQTGDANENGEISIGDMAVTELEISHRYVCTPGADSNRDLRVTSLDLTYLEYILFGLYPAPPSDKAEHGNDALDSLATVSISTPSMCWLEAISPSLLIPVM